MANLRSYVIELKNFLISSCNNSDIINLTLSGGILRHYMPKYAIKICCNLYGYPVPPGQHTLGRSSIIRTTTLLSAHV
jgi:hypothetical protein